MTKPGIEPSFSWFQMIFLLNPRYSIERKIMRQENNNNNKQKHKKQTKPKQLNLRNGSGNFIMTNLLPQNKG